MIIYGRNNTHLHTETVAHVCTECNKINTTQMSVYQKYAHFFWIPMFPIGKTAATQCSHCKKVLAKKEFDNNLKEQYNNLVRKTKIPKWTFAGLAVIIIITVIGVSMSIQNSKRNAKLVADPKAGDVYEIKLGYRSYTVYKVISVKNNTVILLKSTFESNKISRLDEIKNMGDETYLEGQVSKNELKELFDEGKILDVDRK
jgi:hypothetical protein